MLTKERPSPGAHRLFRAGTRRALAATQSALGSVRAPAAPASPAPPIADPAAALHFFILVEEGGVIYLGDENLSRKFVPINISVPGSCLKCWRRGKGQVQCGRGSCCAQPAVLGWPEAAGPRGSPRASHTNPFPSVGGRSCQLESRRVPLGATRARGQRQAWRLRRNRERGCRI